MPGEKYEVVISGVGGVFPECHSFHEFRELLFSGKSGVTVDNRRWPVGKHDLPEHPLSTSTYPITLQCQRREKLERRYFFPFEISCFYLAQKQQKIGGGGNLKVEWSVYRL